MTFDRYLKFVIVAVQWTIKYKCNRMTVFPWWEMDMRGNEICILQYVPIFHQCLAPDSAKLIIPSVPKFAHMKS